MPKPAFPPIADYAVIGDGRTVALVSRDGAIEWLCLPDLDSPSLFAAILDRSRGGSFEIGCEDGRGVSRRYRPDTAVLETDLESAAGRMRVADCLTVEGFEGRALLPQREVLRTITCVSGAPVVTIRIAPAPHYGKRRAVFHDRGATGWALAVGGGQVLVRSDIALSLAGDGALTGSAALSPGKRAAVSLSYCDLAPSVVPALGDAAHGRVAATERWWKNWSSSCTYTGPYREQVMRSVITLKLLQFCLSGAMAAAATTSLPEAIPGARNWDYRFCWLRDSGFVLRAFVDAGFWHEGRAFFDWLMHSTRITQPRLQPLYTLFGRTDIGERTIPTLGGYADCAPVRVGNGAAHQFQLDTYGTVIGAARDFVARGHRLGGFERGLLTRLGKIICASWRSADKGIWEFRQAPRHYTYSKVMAWAGLNDLLWLADNHRLEIPREVFVRERDELGARIAHDGVDESGRRFKGAFDLDYPDASLLLLPRAGFVAANDPRMLGTWDAIRAGLEERGMILRYPRDLDTLKGCEGCFVICSFWAAEYLARLGRFDDAARYFEAASARANDLGLLSEEVDPIHDVMLGNFPQAFSHAGLINAALALEGAQANGRAAA